MMVDRPAQRKSAFNAFTAKLQQYLSFGARCVFRIGDRFQSKTDAAYKSHSRAGGSLLRSSLYNFKKPLLSSSGKQGLMYTKYLHYQLP